MATFKICVRKQRKDGYYPVYIQLTQNRVHAYIKTDKVVTADGVGQASAVTDPYVLEVLNKRVLQFIRRINQAHDSERWTAAQMVRYVTEQEDDICFSVFARRHIDKMKNEGQTRTSENYTYALKKLELFAGTNRIMFSQLTTRFLNEWIKSLEQHFARAKEMYPICIRQIYKAAVLEYNDYDNDIIRIRSNPWAKVQIPKSDVPEKKAITAEACREFFSVAIPDNGMKAPLTELARDVCKLTMCLAGLNTVDMYKMKKDDYYNGIIHYNRSKTSHARSDRAYFEMQVPAIVQPIVDKYLDTDEKSKYLFNFHKRYCSYSSFGANVNNGIHQICKVLNLDHYYCDYTFRHTWSTIAQNDCGASLAEVGFALNHSQRGTNITRGYVKLNFEPAWKLNEKVIDFVFFSDKPSARVVQQEQVAERKAFRISPKMQIKGQAYLNGKCKAAILDTDFKNVDDVKKALVAELPDDIPTGAILQFKLTNLDNGEIAVYEHCFKPD